MINVADGNDFGQLRAAFEEARGVTGMPVAIIAKTIKGKGVSFMKIRQAGTVRLRMRNRQDRQ